MVMDTSTKLVAPTDPNSAQEDRNRGIALYLQGDYTSALYFLTLADEKLNSEKCENMQETISRVRYWTFKAYAMSKHDKSRDFKMRYNPARLEGLVSRDGNALHRRAVRWYERFGRVGLRAHDLLERHGW